MATPKHQSLPPKPPRPADIAIVVSRMLIRLLRKIWKRSFRQLSPGNMAASLILMVLSFQAAIGTVDEDPQTVTQFGTLFEMSRSTMDRYVKLLVKHHRVKMRNNRKRGRGQEGVIIFEIDRLDKLMTLELVDWLIGLIETHLNEMKRLRELLLPQLAANGKPEAAE